MGLSTKLLASLALSLLTVSAHAQRKGPIFQMDEIPAQRVLLQSYLSYNLINAPIANARLVNFTSLYQTLEESDFDVFKSHVFRHTPNLEFSLAFQNHNMGFENKEKKNDQYGFCLGVTTELRKMNLLAFYDPENTSKAQVPKIEDQEAWLNFYKELIDKIMTNRPVIIPGFANLQELSGTPGIKEYMVRHVLNQWAMKNASLYSGFDQMLMGVKREYSKNEAEKLFLDVKQRLARHYPPRLFLSKKNYDKPLFGAQYIHVMEAFEISEKEADGSYKIGVWHINNPWDKATYHVEIRADGSDWMEWRDLGELDIVPGDDAEIAEMVKNLKPFCAKNPDLCL
jgi:hypothetical protein